MNIDIEDRGRLWQDASLDIIMKVIMLKSPYSRYHVGDTSQNCSLCNWELFRFPIHDNSNVISALLKRWETLRII